MLEYPVDVVLTWVDTTDVKWKERYEHTLKQPFTQSARWSPENCPPDTELALCLKLIRQNLTWVRNVFIVTQQQDPACRTENEILIDHSSLGLGLVFNSCAIEAALHRIPGLAEHFIYYNDDFYTVRPLTRSQFFNAEGKTLVRYRTLPLLLVNSEFFKANKRTVQLYGSKHKNICMLHAPYPLTKTQMIAAESMFPLYWNDTRQTTARYGHEREIAPVLATTIHAVHTNTARRAKSGSLNIAFEGDRYFETDRYFIPSPHIVCINAFNGTEKELVDMIERPKLPLEILNIVILIVIILRVIAKIIGADILCK